MGPERRRADAIGKTAHVTLIEEARRAADLAPADPRAGLAAAGDVAASARAAGDDAALVVALRAAAWAARELFDFATATANLDECVTVADRAGLDEGLVEALITRSATHLELGRTDRAVRDLAQARGVGVDSAAAEISFAEGLLFHKAGRSRESVTAYERALGELEGDNAHLEMKVCNNLGLEYAVLGRHDDADRLLRRARDVAASVGPGLLIPVTASMAEAALMAGNPVAAMSRYREVERMCVEADIPLTQLYKAMAEGFAALLLLDEAADAARRAVADMRERGAGPHMLLEGLLPLGEIALARGELTAAHEAATEARDLARRQRRSGYASAAELIALRAVIAAGRATHETVEALRRVEGRLDRGGNRPAAVATAVLLGDTADALGRHRLARNAWGRAAARAEGGGTMLRLQAHLARARVTRGRGQDEQCLDECATGLEELERYRAGMASWELRARTAAHGQALADLGLVVASGRGDPWTTWLWMERSRPTVGADAMVLDEEATALMAQLRDVERQLSSPETPPAVRDGLLGDLTGLERRVREAAWARGGTDGGRAAGSGDAVPALRDLAENLGGRGLIELQPVDGALLAVVATRRGVHQVDLGPAAAAEAAAGRLATAVQRLAIPRSAGLAARARATVEESLAVLSAAVWDPLAALLTGVDELVVSPPAALMAVPWGSVGGLADLPTRVCASATAWARQSTALPASERVALVAGPRVPGAAAEARALAGVHADAECLLDPDARCDAVAAAADGAALVHVASHGRPRADSPTFSSLELSDGPLTVHDVNRMAAPAHRWVLAACELGNPGQPAGPALEGMVSALLSGGAAAVVAATAKLPDALSAPTMLRLHRELAAGRSTAEALLLARQSVPTDTPEGLATSLMLTCFGGG